MDDSAFIASTREQNSVSEQFSKLNVFLDAYGMVANPGKSAHMEVAPLTAPFAEQRPRQRHVHAAASAQTSAPLKNPATAGVPSMEIATLSGEGH
jgi:hypothetical protein